MKLWQWLYGGLLLLVLVAWQLERRQRIAAEGLLLTSQRLNDSTVVRTASPKAEIPSGVKAAAKATRSRVIASVTLKVPARDTVVVHDTVVTVLAPDSTRTATFRDSTFAGVIEGTMTAPPCCAPLALNYRVHRPAFAPSIGFLEAGSRYAAVVTWQGEHVELETPFVAKSLARQRPIAPVAQVLWGPDGVWTAAAGVELRSVFGVKPVALLEQRFAEGEGVRIGVGLRKVF